jgi:hypothetical protein
MELRLVDSDQPGAPKAPGKPRESGLVRRVNTNMRHSAELFASPDPIAFFCECRNPACYAAVPMSRAAFDATVDRSGWLLVEGHKPSEAWHARHPSADRRITRGPDTRAEAGPRARRPIKRRRSSSIRRRLEVVDGTTGAIAPRRPARTSVEAGSPAEQTT